ncbi:MAG TPA: C45 family peptidase [Terriglobia bacterium]|nr:C45 family peptidase [Terriglobia bacterium]
MKKGLFVVGILFSVFGGVHLAQNAVIDLHLRGAYRAPEKNGWVFVHLEGPPDKIGFQHGYLLAEEIVEAQKVIALEFKHDTGKDWQFFRDIAKTELWPHVDEEYRQELLGIVEGLNVRGVKMGIGDIVALNAFPELNPYFVDWWKKTHGEIPTTVAATADRCSAFVATGSYTANGKIVMGHNNWTSYLDGQRWRIIFDIVPQQGHRILMDGFPGLIHSGDDFGVNSGGIMVTETTITRFSGWDPHGIPEFVRARKAMQHAGSIDEFARLMEEGNNGGYANTWLVADRKTNEIASLELGLKNVNLRRSRDGYFCGANFPENEKLTREETEFKLDDLSLSPNARRIRWEQLMAEHKGKIDVKVGQQMLSDHYDSFARKVDPNERTLCGHIELSARGSLPWMPAYSPAGAVQAKVCDAAMAERMSILARLGHPCGDPFIAEEHLTKHVEFNWQKPLLKDMPSQPWTLFSIASKE